MLIRRRRGYEIPESEATPEASVFLNRRHISSGEPGGGLAARSRPPARASWRGGRPDRRPLSGKRNEKLHARPRRHRGEDRRHLQQLLRVRHAQEHPGAAQALPIRPWTVKIDGLVEKPSEIGIDDLIRKMPLEERLYRHRCVEAWSMAVPWTGFPLAALVALRQAAAPARNIVQHARPSWIRTMAPGQRPGLVSLALYRGADHGRGDQRTRLHGHRRLRQAAAEAERRAAPPRAAVEIRLQVGQVDRAASPSPRSGRDASGRRCRRANTASGPT